MTPWMHRLASRLVPLVAIALLVIAMGGTWLVVPRAGASPLELASAPGAAPAAPHPSAPAVPVPVPKSAAASSASAAPRRARALTGKVNLNTATVDELERLPMIGPAKAELIVGWRQKHGGFKRTADLRRVKGIGYKTFKRLESYLDVGGVTTLAAAAGPGR